MISVRALPDGQIVCQTRWIEAAAATAIVMSGRHARVFVVQGDGGTLFHAINGRLLDVFGEPVPETPRVWS